MPLPEATPWTETELLTAEKEALGLFWTGHPIDAHAADLKEFGARTIADLLAADEPPAELDDDQPPGRPPARSGEEISVGGIISATRLLKTRKGDPMAVCTLEDRHGGVEVVVFPETFKTARPLVENRRHGRGARQARARRRDGARAGHRDGGHGHASASGWRGRWPSPSPCRPTGARRSKRWPTCSPIIAATSP